MEIFNALLQIDLENVLENILKKRLEIEWPLYCLEFNKAGQEREWAGGWFGCIMNNCEAKTKNLRQFPASAAISVVPSHILYWPGNCCHQGASSASHHHHNIHIADDCFCSPSLFSRASLVVTRVLLSREVWSLLKSLSVSFWLYPADEQTVCNYWKLFLFTDNTSFCCKNQLSGHITSARGLVSPCCHPECHQTGTFIENERDTMWALIDGRGSSQMAWEMTSLDPWDVMLFAQWIEKVLCRLELATNELLMMVCQEKTGSVRSQQQWGNNRNNGRRLAENIHQRRIFSRKETFLLWPSLSQTGILLWVFVFINICPNMPSLTNDSLRRPSEHFY